MHGVVRDHAHAPAVDAGEAGDQVARPARLQLEELAVVHHRSDHFSHVVRLPRVVGHDVQKRVVAAIGRIAGGSTRRLLSAAEREEREVFAHGRKAGGVVGHLHVGASRDLGVHLAAAELLLGDVLPHHALDQIRPADRHRRGALHHRHEVREARDVCRAGSAGTDHRGHLGHHAREHHLFAEQVARVRERADDRRFVQIGRQARAGGVDQPDQRDPLAERQLAQARHLALADRPDAPPVHGEVVGRDATRPSVDEAGPAHHAVGGRGPLRFFRQLPEVGGEKPDLDKAARIEQQLEPRARVQLAALPLAAQPLLAAHPQRFRPAAAQLLDLVAHRHTRSANYHYLPTFAPPRSIIRMFDPL